MSNVISFVHEKLGNSSYLVQVGEGEAVLVDPDRNVDRYLDTARAHGWKIIAVFETHLHADFVSGVVELAKAIDVALYLPSGAGALFPHNPLAAGQLVNEGNVKIEALATPSHTPEHMSFVFSGRGLSETLLFSGAALIVGGAARTDLISPQMTEPLTRSLYKTLKTAFNSLGDETLLYPTHGGGSFCSAGAGDARTSTLGEQRAQNPLLAIDDEEEFVSWFPTTFPSGIPTYFFRMRSINQSGPRLRSEIPMPKRLTAEEFDEARQREALIIDARPYADFSESHIPGSLNIPFEGLYAPFFGWLVPPGKAVLFVTGDYSVDRLVDESLLVGHEKFSGWLDGGMKAWIAGGKPVADRIEIVDAERASEAIAEGATVLDVREPNEYEAGHVEGAIHVPLGSLEDGLERLPQDRPVLAYCGHGERASKAISILEKAGIGPLMNLSGGMDAWEEAICKSSVAVEG